MRTSGASNLYTGSGQTAERVCLDVLTIVHTACQVEGGPARDQIRKCKSAARGELGMISVVV